MWYLSSWRDLRRRSNAGHGLLNKPEITPPSHSYHRPDASLLGLCAERAHCPHFGLLVGERITLSAFGDLGSLMKVSETLGDALRVFVTYRRLQSNGAVFRLDQTGDEMVLNYLPYEGGPGTGLIA